jgi:hypothetical protein
MLYVISIMMWVIIANVYAHISLHQITQLYTCFIYIYVQYPLVTHPIYVCYYM